MRIGLIDPALYDHNGSTSPNIGDQIISRAVNRELRGMFGETTEILGLPSHAFPTSSSLKKMEDVDYVFVGGSNLLYFRLWWRASWRIGLQGVLHYRNLVLLGVGWGAYAIKPSAYGRWICRRILSQTHEHSVRDEYTRRKATDGLEIPRVLNTACPTMWRLSPDLVGSIRTTKGKECIFSLTDYAQDPASDGQMLRTLKASYAGRLLFWPQGDGDIEYCRSLGYDGKVLDRSLKSFESILRGGVDFDYVGTRLHAGVFCLEHRVRTLIVSIDNRAAEIGRDTGLPLVQRGDTGALEAWLRGSVDCKVVLPAEAIERWKAQFKR